MRPAKEGSGRCVLRFQQSSSNPLEAELATRLLNASTSTAAPDITAIMNRVLLVALAESPDALVCLRTLLPAGGGFEVPRTSESGVATNARSSEVPTPAQTHPPGQLSAIFAKT